MFSVAIKPYKQIPNTSSVTVRYKNQEVTVLSLGNTRKAIDTAISLMDNFDKEVKHVRNA